MGPCERCRENLLEYLYGLLDDEETRLLEEHLPACADCQAALEKAKAGQALLSKAAHVVTEVPVFSLPGSHSIPEAASTPSGLSLHSELAETTPAETAPRETLPLEPARRRSHLRRFWPAWSAAAGIFAAVFGLQYLYQTGHQERQTNVTHARKQIKALDAQFAALQKQVAKDVVKVKEELREGHLHLQAMGPTQYHPAVPAVCRISARDLDGAAAKAEVALKVIEEATGNVLHEETKEIVGDDALTIPPGLALQGATKLVLEAKSGKALEKIEETLTAATSTYATHMVLNKSTFNTGEVLFFRTLTLDRVSHLPPKEPVPLRFSLFNEDGKPVMELTGTTNGGGISAGNFALDENLSSGAYTLLVRPADKTKENILAQSQVVEILAEGLEVEFKAVETAEIRKGEKVQVTVNRERFKPGEEVHAFFRRKSNNKLPTKKADDKDKADSYELRFLVDGRPVPVPANLGGAYSSDMTQRLNLDSYGNAAVTLKLPTDIKNDVVMVLEKKTGASAERYFQTVPVEQTKKSQPKLQVDYFPEGGDLVAGVLNRIYFRVRNELGEPVDPESVTITSKNGIVIHQAHKSGWGCFSFVPQGKESYKTTLETALVPGGKLENAAFEDLNIITDGVALCINEPVATSGAPIQLVLRNPVPKAKRRLLLLASCRGVVFDQRLLTIEKGETDARIDVPAGIDGLMRVTLLEIGAGEKAVRPLAERLVFRAPRERLEVGCTPDKTTSRAGQPYRMNIDVKDEKKAHSDAWILAAVVDERVRSPYSEANLPAFFHIATGVSRGEELDQALIHLTADEKKDKDGAIALDLYLSIHGWRRLTEGTEDATKKVGEEKGAAVREISLPIFSRETGSLPRQQIAYDKKLVEKLVAQQRDADKAQAELVEERKATLKNAEAAATDLAQFEVLPQVYFWLALGFVLLILLAAGVLALLFALYRHAKAASPRPALVVSCICLGLAFCLFVGGKQARPESIDARVARLPMQPWKEIEIAILKERPQLKTPDLPVSGPFLVQATEPEDDAKVLLKAKDQPVFVTLAKVLAADGLGRQDKEQMKHGRSTTYSPDVGDRYPVPVTLFSEEMDSRFKIAQEAQRNVRDESEEKSKGKERDKDKKGEKKEPSMKEPAFDAPTALPPPPATHGYDVEGRGDADKGKLDASADDVNLLVREYAYRAFPIRPYYQHTVLWSPALFAEKGRAQVRFDLSPDVSAYRVLLFANSPTGRLGFYEGRLEVRPEAAGK
jgi:hypothetical protein